MDFRIADTFTDSLAKLTDEEQKAIKATAFDLQMNSVNPGMQFHKLDKGKDKNFWSVRVSSDIRTLPELTPGHARRRGAVRVACGISSSRRSFRASNGYAP